MGLLLFAVLFFQGDVSTPLPAKGGTLAADRDGNLYIGYTSAPDLYNTGDAVVAKIDPRTQHFVWRRNLNSAPGARLTSLKVGPDGFVYAAGVSYTAGFSHHFGSIY